MEKNTINLSVEDYNEMRYFNESIKKKNCIRVFWGWGDRYGTEIYSTEEAVKIISETNVKLAEEINKLKNPEKKQPSFEELRKMSWWQFKKWKRGI